MARFDERDDRPRPSAPSGSGGFGDDDARGTLKTLSGLLDRQYTPKASTVGRLAWRLVPRFVRDRMPALQPSRELAERSRFVMGLLQLAGLAVLACAAVAFVIAGASNAIIREPSNAREVLELVSEPRDVAWSVETVRTKNIDGAVLRTDTIRGFQVDLKTGKFRAHVTGLDDDQFRMVGDGRIALYQKGSFNPGVLAKHPAREQLRPVLAADLRATAGRVLNNKATVAGRQGWYVDFKATPRLILQLLSVDLLNIKGADIDAIRAGRYKVRQATATVIRDQRRLYRIHVFLEVNGARLAIIATYRSYNTGLLRGFELDERTPDLG